jgi:leucyl aminopeptidase
LSENIQTPSYRVRLSSWMSRAGRTGRRCAPGSGQGSQTPPRLIVIEYPGDGHAAGRQPVVLVGKAITFDTGGYSIKDTTHIVGMKYDKCGGMDVLATDAGGRRPAIETPLVGVIARRRI